MALRLPPLRERIEDIAPLALHFLHRYATQYRREVQQFSAEALNKLRAYGWPGNVRELETVVQRSLLLTSSSIIRADDIELPVPYESTGSGEASFREAKLRVIEQFERAYLISLLSAHKGNITQAAKQAGKERRTFARLLQKHQLEGNTFRV
jgi:two-component system response regulator GlrR